MKATGIVRRIDDLGRVVIPKEIRRTMRIREGDPLEIFTDREGEVILKKYSPIGELGEFASEYADSLNESLGHISCIADKDSIIAVAGAPKKQLMNKQIGNVVENVMADRKMAIFNEPCYLTSDEDISYNSAIIAPIIASGDAVGAVIIATKDTGMQMGNLETKLAETAAGFLAKQMES
ncbi:MAG: Stage V sporulation protein T [Pelotomaculum sp. PtaU1.Bin035]|nr:MAG: Stage V sporulation protein T [Pelotomaculum sp. PtaU1.Bin035]